MSPKWAKRRMTVTAVLDNGPMAHNGSKSHNEKPDLDIAQRDGVEPVVEHGDEERAGPHVVAVALHDVTESVRLENSDSVQKEIAPRAYRVKFLKIHNGCVLCRSPLADYVTSYLTEPSTKNTKI